MQNYLISRIFILPRFLLIILIILGLLWPLKINFKIHLIKSLKQFSKNEFLFKKNISNKKELFFLHQGFKQISTFNNFSLMQIRKDLKNKYEPIFFRYQKSLINEKKQILKKSNNFTLNEKFCLNIKHLDNFSFCQQHLRNKIQNCKKQGFEGSNIYIDLQSQVLFAVKDCRLLAFSRIISGKNSTPSPVGSFKITSKRGPHLMQRQWAVKKALYFFGGYALHDASWRVDQYWKKEARALYGSHGCINLPKKTIEILWNNFNLQDEVHIFKYLPLEIAQKLYQKVKIDSLIDPLKDFYSFNSYWQQGKKLIAGSKPPT